MLTTKATEFGSPDEDYGVRIKFHVLTQDSDKPFLSFEYPYMSRHGLQKLLKGEDFEDQDDNGVSIKMEDEMFTILIDRGENCEQQMKLTLPFEVCRPAFEQMVPIYDRIARLAGYENSDAERDGYWK
jgi:hypothetical protein